MEKITKRQTQEEVKVHAKYVCEYCETCNRVWQAATQLIRGKWAGKKLDKRFTNELNAMFADELFEMGDGRKSPNIDVAIIERFGDKVIRIGILKNSYMYQGRSCYFGKEVYGSDVTLWSKMLESDGRIITEKVLSGIELAMDSNNERIFRLQDAAKNYKKHLQAYDKAKRQFLDAIGKINPMFVETDVCTYEIGAPWRVQMEQQLGIYQKQYICLQ